MLSFVIANLLLFSVVLAGVRWAVREERRRNERKGSLARDH
jgi:hypothetical protein